MHSFIRTNPNDSALQTDANIDTYDCDGRTETSIRQEQILKLQLSKWFVRVWIKRCAFNSSPRTDDGVPAEDAVKDAAMFLHTGNAINAF